VEDIKTKMNKFIKIFLNNNRIKEILKNDPLVIVDIGAAYPSKNFYDEFKNFVKLISFDPQIENSYKKENFYFINNALYDEKTKLNFYKTKNPQCSSLLIPNYDFLEAFGKSEEFKIIETTEIEVDTLDNQLKNLNINNVDFIKLDTQGSELYILEGSSKYLENVLGIETEIEFKPIYQGQPLFFDVDNYLKSKNFELLDLRKIYWKRGKFRSAPNYKGELIWGEALYFKNLKKLKIMSETKLIKAALLLLVYNKIDLAYEILEYTNFSFLNKYFKGTLITLPKIKGKYRLAKILNKIEKMLLYNKKSGDLIDIELKDEQ
jgi:FkbM family methyltransferase